MLKCLSRAYSSSPPRLCKGIQDSLRFWIPIRGFRIPATGFRFRCPLNLDSGLQLLVGSRLLAIFSKALDSGLHKQRFPGFRTLQAKTPWIPESGVPYIGRYVPTLRLCSPPKHLPTSHQLYHCILQS